METSLCFRKSWGLGQWELDGVSERILIPVIQDFFNNWRWFSNEWEGLSYFPFTLGDSQYATFIKSSFEINIFLIKTLWLVHSFIGPGTSKSSNRGNWEREQRKKQDNPMMEEGRIRKRNIITSPHPISTLRSLLCSSFKQRQIYLDSWHNVILLSDLK